MAHLRTMAVVAALACGVVGFDVRAAAQDQAAEESGEGEARMHFRVGRAYYESGRFAEAAREFQMAYDLSHRPALLYNVFVAHRDAGNVGPAIHALREYLRLNPDAEEREQLTARLATMERMAQQQGLGTQATSSEPSATPSASASDGTPPESGGGGGSMWVPGWIVAGVGAAAVVAGVVTGFLALGEQAALDPWCDDARICDPGFEPTRDRAGMLAGITDALLIGGGVVAVAGVVLALVVPSGDRDSPSASIMCTSQGCVGVGTIRF